MQRHMTAGRGWWVVAVVAVLLVLAGGPARAASAAEVTFTVTAHSAFLRAAPSFTATPQHSVFAGESYLVLAQNADGTWLLLNYPGAARGSTWIAAAFGQVSGSLNTVPVSTQTAADAVPSASATPAAGHTASGPAGPVYYTVTANSLFGRAGPDLKAAKVASLFKGQRYAADARSADSHWLRLRLPSGPAWVPAAYGTVTGTAALLPVSTADVAAAATPATPTTPASTATTGAVSGWVSVSDTARAIYQRGLTLGNDPHAFSKVGDCNSSTPYFLAPFDKGEYRLGSQYAYLQATIDQFAGSFNRDGAVARDGLNTASVFDAIWSPPALCQRNESPLACELRTHQPSIAFISLGTNGGWQTDAEYDANMRKIIDFAIERGVLPILSTKADNLEGDGRFNRIVRQLAAEYELPLWDWANVAWTLPGGGLADDYHLVWGQPYYDTAPSPLLGWQARNLTALQALDAVWHGAK